ncbi:P-loop NTPase fold protein [Streptococcus loxodontisalivarius]|uniref:KAP NTPase domain-containing protein n=1 Tax=Streptococcus loxodontisalivarius TaxID=1349415 RepID=A0ABS2PWB8_9STRE|nr:P-loop NTPase fold protein [Streptococcus loxodontisalivarius]MBM7643759.1 hypothetical protein [Streptococcus loxodontisalivarius]
MKSFLKENWNNILIVSWTLFFINKTIHLSSMLLYSIGVSWNITVFYYKLVFYLLSILTVGTILIKCCLSKKEKEKKFELLDREKYGEYDNKDYHIKLKEFLNDEGDSNKYSDSQKNVFWLDGPWGVGKTRFIDTFFSYGNNKTNHLYKISCFGLKTRENLESELKKTIEEKTIMSILKKIPLIGDIFSVVSEISGINYIKSGSIIIFDDIERTAYYDENSSSSLEEFNAIFSFIDYISSKFTIKVVVLYNSELTPKDEFLWSKFKVNKYKMDITLDKLQSVFEKNFSEKKDTDSYSFLYYYYKFLIVSDCKVNFREIHSKFDVLDSAQDKKQISDGVVSILNELLIDSIGLRYSINNSYYYTDYAFFNSRVDFHSIIDPNSVENSEDFMNIFEVLRNWEINDTKVFKKMKLDFKDYSNRIVYDDLLLDDLPPEDFESQFKLSDFIFIGFEFLLSYFSFLKNWAKAVKATRAIPIRTPFPRLLR